MIENKASSFEIDNESLKLLSAGLNDEQLLAVKETRNVVVSAGAGSGKTTVLASRYAYLVEAKNVPCEKILTLTFTKKAANEMKERIFYGLKNHIAGYPIRRKADTEPLPADFPHIDLIKSRARDAIEKFDRAHIQTLDSYFSEIAKKGAHFYGINPNFTLDDEKISSTIRQKATKYVLEHLNDSEIKEIAQVFQIQNVAEELFASAVLKFSTILTPIDFASSLEKQKKCLIEDYKAITSRIYDEISSYIVLPRNPKPSQSLGKLYDYIDETGNPDSPALLEGVFESVESAKSFLDKRFLSYFKAVSDYCGGDFSACWRDSNYSAMKANLQPMLEKLYLIANSISGFALQKKVFAHLAAFQSEMIRTKRVSGLLTFSDVSLLALATLREHQEIRSIEQQKFDAIMIDEFQDDNQLQCDVLLILCDQNEKFDSDGNYLVPNLFDSDLLERLDTHKLFFVGDDKQSIYRFRGADVSVFRNLSSSIKNSIELKTNYRSNPELIRSFNTIFGGYDYPDALKVNDSLNAVFMTKEKFPKNPSGEEQIPNFEADYRRVEVPAFKLKKCDFSEKKVTLALYPKKETEEALSTSSSESSENLENPENSDGIELERKAYDCEASFVAREINKLLQEKTTDKDGNLVQKYHYSDIALLFRTSTPTAAYERVLLEAGIPYSTEVYKGFFSDGPINDIISLLKLCVYPEDKNAWAKVLRSPFCSLTFAEVEKVLVNCENPYKKPFDEQLLAAISLDSDLSEKILNLKAIYDDINERLKTEKLTKTISYIWYELGYRYETLWNKAVAMYSSFYDILFEMARLAEEKTQSLASFIDMVKSYEDDRKLDGLDVVMDAEDAVQILTIHKSKGLEYKVVFVCAASGVPKEFGSGIDYDEKFGFLLKTPAWSNSQKGIGGTYFLSLVDQENKNQEAAELRRLAYVAFTRAEEKLYIVGSENGEFKDEAEAEKKCRKFELHTADNKTFTYLQTCERKNGEIKPFKEPKEKTEDFVNPKTIYQLLLPMIFADVCEGKDGGIDVKNPAFNFVNDIDSFKTVLNEDAQQPLKSDYIKNLCEFENADVVTEKLSPKLYVSPSKLTSESENAPAKMFREGELPFDFDEQPANPEYELINAIVASTIPVGAGEKIPAMEDFGEEGENPLSPAPEMSPAFSFADFGTIAHACMEAKVLGEEPKINGRELIGVNESFISNVGMEKWTENARDTNRDKKIAKIKELCADMAKKFENSSLYKEAIASDWKKTEYSFRSVIENSLVPKEEGVEYAEELIVSGQIDLLYKNEANSPYKYTIVDYKTNQKIEPEIYRNQLLCYRRAVSQMFGCDESEIRCVLYYLRYAKEVDLTAKS
ncbi:exodeoxyribonuclease V subunit beta [uncultured Treponema sp.]|uniref:UvrD-helicase domain-containing protein n=1 Tax=uncultured Treponema sp. TaxID=162155 RepID=UPI0025FC8B7A|nr:UvrD-helicase domain-containing protein [uncultured Treponema sp.]